jgi:hypothetical protein
MIKKKSAKSIGQRLSVLREQIRVHEQDEGQIAANDLFNDIQMRWGPGFAQWVADGLKDGSAPG